MTLPSILALAGCVALFISLVGGGVTAQQIVVPTDF